MDSFKDITLKFFNMLTEYEIIHIQMTLLCVLEGADKATLVVVATLSLGGMLYLLKEAQAIWPWQYSSVKTCSVVWTRLSSTDSI